LLVPLRLRGVSALATNHVWAVGDQGIILHFDGQAWNVQESGTTKCLYGVCAHDDQNVWAVGESGTIVHYDGTNWNQQTSGTVNWLYAVSAPEAGQVWAVGFNGTLLYWNGTNWSAQASGTTKALWGVSASDAGNVWAVGAAGTLLHWNGTDWQPQRHGYAMQDWFWGVSARNANQAWAVGYLDNESRGLILHATPGQLASAKPAYFPVPSPAAAPTGSETELRDAIIPQASLVAANPRNALTSPVLGAGAAVPLAPARSNGGLALPSRVDLSVEMPPVQDQTDINLGAQSCGPWACAYAQLTQWVKHFKRPAWDMTDPEHWLSPGFLCIASSSAIASYSELTNYGCVDMAEYPFEPTLSGPYPTLTQLEAAKPFRINGYGALWDHGVTNAPYPGNDVELAKGWLADGYVLASEIETENGDWPDSHQNPSAVFYDPPGKTNGSNHWVALCGYDDNINPSGADPDHRGGFLMMNCWGDSWNCQMGGFVWLSYAWVRGYVPSAFVLWGDGPDAPVITGCFPLSARAGDTVTITGNNFGGLRRQAGVSFNGTPATIVSFTDVSITVTVPPGATSGPLVVSDWEGTPSNSFYFGVTPDAGVGANSVEEKLAK
jgi:hypothetical protein